MKIDLSGDNHSLVAYSTADNIIEIYDVGKRTTRFPFGGIQLAKTPDIYKKAFLLSFKFIYPF